MGAKGWIIFSVIAVGLLSVLIYFSGQNKIDVEGLNFDSIIAAQDRNGNIADHVLGNKDSEVILIEYGDFQCPGCAGVNPDVKELVDRYQDHIAFIFRNKPLPEIHPNARYAAAVAEAAAKQDRYWQMHDLLYLKQTEWSGVSSSDRTAVFEQYARDLGLNVTQLNEDIASESVTKKINFDLAISREKNVNSTPSFTLNGTQLEQDTWGSIDSFEQAIRDAIIASGVDPKELPELETEEATEEKEDS